MFKIWQWLDGKKRNFALLYWSIAMPSVLIIWPEGAPATVDKVLAIIGVVFTATGYGHAGLKAKGAGGGKK